jgi:hypothetical protein
VSGDGGTFTVPFLNRIAGLTRAADKEVWSQTRRPKQLDRVLGWLGLLFTHDADDWDERHVEEAPAGESRKRCPWGKLEGCQVVLRGATWLPYLKEAG